MNASDRLEPFYQPIADLGSGIIVGFESKPHLSSAGNVAKCASWVFEHKNIEPQTRFRLDNAMSYKAVQYFSQRNDCAQLFINIRPEWLNPLFANIDPAVLRASEKLGNDQADIVVQIPENSIDQAFVLYLCTKLKMANIKIAVTECNLNTSAMAAIAALQPDYVKLQAPSKSRDTNKNVTETARRIRQLHNETPCDVIVSDIYNESDFCFAIDSGADKIQGPLIAKSRREASSRFYALEQITQLKKRRLNSKTQHLKASFKNEHQTTRHMQILLNAFHTNTLKSVMQHRLNKQASFDFSPAIASATKYHPNLFSKMVVYLAACTLWVGTGRTAQISRCCTH